MLNTTRFSRPWRRTIGFAVTSFVLAGAIQVPSASANEPLPVIPPIPQIPIIPVPLPSDVSKKDVKTQVFTDRYTYKPDEVIQVRLQATNVSNKKQTLTFSSSQRVEFKVYRGADPNPVYTWSADKMFAMQTGTLELKKNSDQSFSEQLNVGQLAPGNYRVEGNLTSQPNLGVGTAKFEIVGKSTASDGPVANGKVKLTASTNKKTYVVGEPVQINFALANKGTNAATLNFKSGLQYDIFVRNENDKVVWQWSANKKFIMSQVPMTLQANESKGYSETWNQTVLDPFKLRPGKYEIQVVFEAQPRIKAEPLSIRIQKN